MERLKIAENKRYFVTADGKPFTWLADTAWTMPQRMKWDDVEYYMKKRKSQGFTVLQIVALDPERDVKMCNPVGEKALIGDNLLTPNEKYFQYLDWILDQAQEYGFYVLLLPVWGQLVVGDDWAGGTYDKIVTQENAYEYGRFIGNRYKERTNLLWCLGGDRQPIHKGICYKKVWRNMAEGLAMGLIGEPLKSDVKNEKWKEMMITYHACHEMETGECSTMSYWDETEAWISFIMIQSGHGLIPKNYELIKSEYERGEVMPVWDGEPAYEQMPTSWPVITSYHGAWMVRKRAYWSLFAGSFGHTYGHASIWCSIAEREKNSFTTLSWVEALESKGSYQMKVLRDFMEAIPSGMCTPCQEIILSQENDDEKMDEHKQACYNQEQNLLAIYFPSGGKASLDVSKLVGTMANIWWFSPKDGVFYNEKLEGKETPALSQKKTTTMEVIAPTSGAEEDWICIITMDCEQLPVQPRVYMELKEKQDEKKVFEW